MREPFSFISSTNGVILAFCTQEEKAAFLRDEEELYKKHYRILREKYGIYCTNQGTYVKNPSMLNKLDSHFMEKLCGYETL